MNLEKIFVNNKKSFNLLLNNFYAFGLFFYQIIDEYLIVMHDFKKAFNAELLATS